MTHTLPFEGAARIETAEIALCGPGVQYPYRLLLLIGFHEDGSTDVVMVGEQVSVDEPGDRPINSASRFIDLAYEQILRGVYVDPEKIRWWAWFPGECLAGVRVHTDVLYDGGWWDRRRKRLPRRYFVERGFDMGLPEPEALTQAYEAVRPRRKAA